MICKFKWFGQYSIFYVFHKGDFKCCAVAFIKRKSSNSHRLEVDYKCPYVKICLENVAFYFLIHVVKESLEISDEMEDHVINNR